MDVGALYYGPILIVEAYLGRELVYTQDLGVLRPVFLGILLASIEISGDAEMVSAASAPMAVDSDAISFDLEDTELSSQNSAPLSVNSDVITFLLDGPELYSRSSASARAEGGMEFMSESEAYAGHSAVADTLEEGIEIATEAEGHAGIAVPAKGEGQAEISTEAEAGAGVAVPLGGEALAEVESECELDISSSCPASGEVMVQIEAEVTVKALPMPKLIDGVLYIPSAYGASLNGGILEVI